MVVTKHSVLSDGRTRPFAARLRRVAPLIVVVAGLALACDDDEPTTTAPNPSTTEVSNVAASPNPNNALSAIVTFSATGADSVRVVYLPDTGASGATPATAATDSGRIVVLGLRPATAYRFVVEAGGAGGTTASDTIPFTTDTLPTFLQATRFDSDAPSSGGYIITAVGDSTTAYAAAFDSAGDLRWYRAFAEGVPAGEIKQQQNGNITVFLGATHGGEPVPGRYVEVSPEGNVVRTFEAPDSAFMDNHEFWLQFTEDGTYDGAVYFTYTQRHVDLSAQGGPSDTVISGHQVVREAADGSRRVVFDAWDHYEVSDNVEAIPGSADFDHPNALAIDSDGNYLVSWRNLDAITKIDANTGEIIWTLSPPWSAIPSDFTITGDPLNGFSAQHSIRIADNGNLVLFDNGTHHSPPTSRAVEYRLDQNAGTATMTWEYRHTPPLYTEFTGSVQRFANGNTLIGWTWSQPLTATEVTPEGTIAWEGVLRSPQGLLPYRFTKIVSLYRYERP